MQLIHFYLIFPFSSMRKKGYQQALSFLTKHQKNMTLNSTTTNEMSTTLNDGSTATNASFLDDDLSMTPLSKSSIPSFNLNDFLNRYSAEKYCDLVTRLKRTTRTFAQTNYSLTDGQQSVVPIFQVKLGTIRLALFLNSNSFNYYTLLDREFTQSLQYIYIRFDRH